MNLCSFVLKALCLKAPNALRTRPLTCGHLEGMDGAHLYPERGSTDQATSEYRTMKATCVVGNLSTSSHYHQFSAPIKLMNPLPISVSLCVKWE